MGNRLAIFIDGGYIEKVCMNDLGKIFIDYKIFPNIVANSISPDCEILRTYFYHCLPYMGNNPSANDHTRFRKKQSYFDSLDKLPRFEVRKGKLVCRGIDKNTNKPIFQQKRVDIKMGVDLVSLSAKNAINTAAIIAGDADFIPAIKFAKNDGVFICLFHGKRKSSELWDISDERKELSKTFLKNAVMKKK